MLKALLVFTCILVWLPPSDEDETETAIKELAIGIPARILSETITWLCPVLVEKGDLFDYLDDPSEPIYFEFMTSTDIQKVDVTKANELIDLPGFEAMRPTVIIIFGWLNGILPPDNDIIDAYLKRNDANVVKLNTYHHIDKFYPKSAENSQMLGKRVAGGLLALSKVYDINLVHLIGFSLGAQIASAAGRFYQEMTGVLLQHITGLDPAKPCFYTSELPGLSRSDAQFVDVIHTNPGALGTDKVAAHIDFFVGGTNVIQSNCLEITCSHMRSLQYYAESVSPGNERNFLARWCWPSDSEPTPSCNGPITYMGYLTKENDVQGVYYLEVNDSPPYGKNTE